MGRHEERALLRELLEHLADGAFLLGVEVRRGFVEEHEVGIVHDGRRDEEPRRLAAREARDGRLRARLQAGAREDAIGAAAHAVDRREELGILARRDALDLRLLLHHDADAPARVWARAFSEEPDLARGRRGEALQDVEQRRLARAVRAEHGDEAGALDREADVVERERLAESLAEPHGRDDLLVLRDDHAARILPEKRSIERRPLPRLSSRIMPSEERLLHETTSLCKDCKEAVPARVVATAADEVWMQKGCLARSAGGAALDERRVVHADARHRAADAPPAKVKPEVEHGCPFDCGPCESHTQKVRLPVVTITSACDLDCPMCYVHNKNDDAFHMGPEEFGRVLDHLVGDHGGDLDIVNLTGGEPPPAPALARVRRDGARARIHRVSICSNGVRLAKDEALVKALADRGARIALSFDTFENTSTRRCKARRSWISRRRCSSSWTNTASTRRSSR